MVQGAWLLLKLLADFGITHVMLAFQECRM
jgi:hypothetical protein